MALTSAPPHTVAATINGRIERHDDRIEAFFDSIGVKLTHCEEDADQPFLRINEVALTVGA